MINKLIILSAISFLMIGCSGDKYTDPLLIPPNFNEIPDLKNPEKPTSNSSDQDLQELKDLLLNNDN
ncbi:MAG: hypothetical protein ACJATU_000990 [Rickettsiales bacterium]|jgi:hypothetical protein